MRGACGAPVNAASPARWTLRLLVGALGLFAVLVWGATYVLLCLAEPTTADGASDGANAAASPPVAPADAARPVPSAGRTAATARGALGPSAIDDAPVAIDELPAEQRQDVRAAIRSCWHACQQLGIPIAVEVWPRLRPSAALRLIQREAQLQQEMLHSALREQELMTARLAANPSLGLRVPAADRARLEAALPARYPGWPHGYRFVEDSDGSEIRIAAWKVDGDPELAQLVRDHDALVGDYAPAVRAGYRTWFEP